MKTIFLFVTCLISGAGAFAESNFSMNGDDATSLINILNKTKYASFVQNNELKVATTFLVGNFTCVRFQYEPVGLCSVAVEGANRDISNREDSVKIFEILKKAIDQNRSNPISETAPIVAKNLICQKALAVGAIPSCDVTIL